MSQLPGGPIRQIAYFVPDIVSAARNHARLFGSGPYYVAEHIPLTASFYRGKATPFDHSSAYGQWGDVMIEFVQQNNPEPSCFRDLYPDGKQGMHHVALIVDNLQHSMKAFEREGHEAALFAEVTSGIGFAMMDCVAKLGHFIELYEPTKPLLAVYDLVKHAAQDFDGTDLIRNFPTRV